MSTPFAGSRWGEYQRLRAAAREKRTKFLNGVKPASRTKIDVLGCPSGAWAGACLLRRLSEVRSERTKSASTRGASEMQKER